MLTSKPTDLIVEELCSDWDILSAEMFRKPGHWPSLVSLFLIHCVELPWSQLIFDWNSWRVRFNGFLKIGDLFGSPFYGLLLPFPQSREYSTVLGANIQGIADGTTSSSLNLQFCILRRTGGQGGSKGETVWRKRNLRNVCCLLGTVSHLVNLSIDCSLHQS